MFLGSLKGCMSRSSRGAPTLVYRNILYTVYLCSQKIILEVKFVYNYSMKCTPPPLHVKDTCFNLAYGVYQVFPNILCLLRVPLYVCRLFINFEDLCARLLGMDALRILLLTVTSRFVIDFLSIRKVIIFSAIATDDRHPLGSRSIHQNAANCMTIRFRYIAQPRGYGKPTAHAHVMMFAALPVGRTACRVRR